MIKSQVLPNVNVEAHTDTPLITQFHTTSTQCLTIIERDTHTGTRYAIVAADSITGKTIDVLPGQQKYTTPAAALEGAAKLSLDMAMPVKPTLIAGVDWNAINAEVSARLYQRGFDAFDQSNGDADRGWCQTEQRIYAGPVVATRTINIHPARILDNEVTRQGWAAAAALDEADAHLSRPNFAFDTDIEGVPNYA